MTWLWNFLKQLWQIFLTGATDASNQQQADQAQQKVDAAAAHEQSVVEATKVEADIAKAEADAKAKVDAVKPTDSDPFGSTDWNQST